MATQYAQITDDAFIHCREIPELDSEVLKNVIKQHHFAAIRGLFDADELEACVARLTADFSADDDHASVGEARESVRTNFQKLIVGGASMRANNCPRFLRTIYNPVWCEDLYGMRSQFLKLIRLRNRIYGIREDFALEGPEENGLWSATRLHQYPQGGGFFFGHTDNIALGVAQEKSFNYYQLILVLNKKGVDYQSGGAFLECNDQRLLLEDVAEVGDVLVYDGRTFHGVEDIDPHLKPDLSQINGRLIAMATLYKL